MTRNHTICLTIDIALFVYVIFIAKCSLAVIVRRVEKTWRRYMLACFRTMTNFVYKGWFTLLRQDKAGQDGIADRFSEIFCLVPSCPALSCSNSANQPNTRKEYCSCTTYSKCSCPPRPANYRAIKPLRWNVFEVRTSEGIVWIEGYQRPWESKIVVCARPKWQAWSMLYEDRCL